jgi:quercetin dioxygenase-like cupin family protein
VVDEPPTAVVADLSRVDLGRAGVAWSLPHGGDLDANAVALASGGSIGEHVNDDVDVLLVVRSGDGELDVEGRRHRLQTDVVVLVPRGTRRALTAGAGGLTYLSIHRRRPPLTIRRSDRPGR